MVLKLDSRFPQVWRSPSSLQFGVTTPAVVLNDVTSADERMIAALGAGVSEPGLAMIAASAGAAADSVAGLLRLLAPVLTGSTPDVAGSVTVVGTGPTQARIGDFLRDEGVGVRHATTDDPAVEPCDVAVAVGHFVLEPRLHGLWLRLDIPHLPVTIADSTVSIGPIVEPGIGPCLYCLHRYRTDGDPAWPAIAAQLWGRRSAAETRRVASETAAIASRMVVDRLRRGAAASAHTSTELSVATGTVQTREWRPHPECGCIAVADRAGSNDVSARVPAGNGWPVAGPRETFRPRSIQRPPTTGAASGEPA
jgi:bacteriocin biosynthesis cyclodehydratase domain-containing protein